MEYTCRYLSPLGEIVLASDGAALTGLWFVGQKHFAPGPGREERALPIFEQTVAWLDCYFGGNAPEHRPPLSAETTPFRRAVRESLLEIPRGRTLSYGELARIVAARIGKDAVSPRAVGAALGRNPISLIVPCHRVIGADGSLTGYAGGLERKRRLLELEGADMTKLRMPPGAAAP